MLTKRAIELEKKFYQDMEEAIYFAAAALSSGDHSNKAPARKKAAVFSRQGADDLHLEKTRRPDKGAFAQADNKPASIYHRQQYRPAVFHGTVL